MTDWLFISLQVAASITTLLGVHYGTTEKAGAAWYAFSMVFWWWLMFRGELWGLAPLNFGMTIVCAKNLRKTWRAA